MSYREAIQSITQEPVYVILLALIVFFYKTFLNMYIEQDKQDASTNLKKGEVLGKMEAAIMNYFSSSKEHDDQSQLIDKLGEGALFMSTDSKRALRQFYKKRSDIALYTIRKEIVKELDALVVVQGSKNEILDNTIDYITRIARPVLPSLLLIVALLVSVSFYMHVSVAGLPEAVYITCRFISWICSLIVGLATLQSLFISTIRRNTTRNTWLITIFVIILPYITIPFTAWLSILSLGGQVVLILMQIKISRGQRAKKKEAY
ncbi:hypothetical protein ACVNS2_33485 [Paenibacillus caseinilyticus]|uniref:Uncharacterized protein n=1 Tax=Paenibacillus mucilaginosus K02 TaxID=997761 RepID=I0BTC6_9BACL|nr:hypothetical protein [Paenibacillus mucilaginosus]AFH65623.1 hypothetical protein B2K_33830 [Paenibacillus mucilaginosus K02]